MKKQNLQTLPKSAIGKVLGYSIERCNELMAYLLIENLTMIIILSGTASGQLQPEKTTSLPDLTKQPGGVRYYIRLWVLVN